VKTAPEKLPYRGHTLILLVLFTLYSISILYSVYLLSVILFLVGLLSILKINVRPIRLHFRTDFFRQMSCMLNKPEWWLVSVPFFLVLFGGLYSDDTTYWLSRMRIKVPFLLLPMAFYMLPKINSITYIRAHMIFILVMGLSTIPLSWYMLNHYTEVIDALSHGRPVSTPVSHIRYSLFLAFSICSAFIISNRSDLSKVDRNGLKFLAIYLTVFLHFLAVRSGIAALYLVAIYFLFRYMLKTQKRATTAGLALGILLIPLFAYQLIPSFKQRMDYMMEDASKYRQMEWNDYSDAERILSIRAGMAIAKQHSAVGTGTGDLRSEMQDYFYRVYDKDTYIMPHNQFISVLAGSGVIGLILFILALIWPLHHWSKYRSQNHLFITLSLIVLISLLVENTFETSIGVAFYLFFTLLGIKLNENQE